MTEFVWLIVVTAVALQRGAGQFARGFFRGLRPGGDQPPPSSCSQVRHSLRNSPRTSWR